MEDIKHITRFFRGILYDLKKKIVKRGYNSIVILIIYYNYVINIKITNRRPGSISLAKA